MTEERAPFSTKTIIVCLVVSLISSSIMLGAAIYLRITEEDRLVSGLIENCEHNGNPLREGLREEKEIEIGEEEHPELPILEALHISPAKALELAQPRIEKLREDINTRYAPIDCSAIFK